MTEKTEAVSYHLSPIPKYFYSSRQKKKPEAVKLRTNPETKKRMYLPQAKFVKSFWRMFANNQYDFSYHYFLR